MYEGTEGHEQPLTMSVPVKISQPSAASVP